MDEKEVTEAIGKYSNLSQDQLMTELVKHMAVQKEKDGGASMRQTIDRILPLLNAEQKKRLQGILQNVEKRS